MGTIQNPPKAPRGLRTPGRALWKAVTTTYELRPDELTVLESAARSADLIRRMEEEMISAGLTVPGSKGQVVISPVVQELRLQKLALVRLLYALGLPDEDVPGLNLDKARSTLARQAAMERWRVG